MADLVLSDLQVRAIKTVKVWYDAAPHRDDLRMIRDNGGFVTPYKFYLAGYAGAGKTQIIPDMVSFLGLDHASVTFIAPTAKAAKVLSGKLKAMFGSDKVQARTIHSCIYIPARALVEALREEIRTLEQELTDFQLTMAGDAGVSKEAVRNRIAEKQAVIDQKEMEFEKASREHRRNGPSFVLNTESAIKDTKLIIVDEASMVGEEIANDLFTFGIPVLAVGDPAQLPPVKDVPGLTNGTPDFFLDEIHRQAADNPIIRLTMDIRQGKSIRPCTMGEAVRIVSQRNDKWTLNPDYDAQVICGKNMTRWALTSSIREMCGFTSDAPMKDEPLIVRKNSKKYPALVNGGIVTCEGSLPELIEGDSSFFMDITDENGDTYSVEAYQGMFEEHKGLMKDYASAPKYAAFDAKRSAEIFDWAWCITTHAAQGSQWDRVIVHDESAVFKQDAIRWLYTAASRASEELVIVL